MSAPLQTLPSAAAAADWLRAAMAPRAGRLRTDSRRLQPGDAFIAWPGATHDGRRFVAQALAAGASACLVEAAGADELALDVDPRIAALPGLKAAAGVIADEVLGHPSRQLAMLAITGTNGKTSSAWWAAQCLGALGQRAAVVGTLGAGEPPQIAAAARPAAWPLAETGLTTPDAVSLHSALRDFADAGFAACAMEASSIGLAEQRLAGLKIDVALFTNFTRDHLDYHGSMADYWAAKRALFAWPGLQAAVVNIDDEAGAALADELAAQASGPALWTVSLHRPARLRASGLHYAAHGLAFSVEEQGDAAPQAVQTQLVGDYNASNLLGVIAALRALGQPLSAACAVAARVTSVPGRLQPVQGDGDELQVLVDYAHTPDALDQVLRALRPLATARGGRLWCVFGCGGNRDATKRPLMGAIAARGADQVVVTSDNPRLEPPAQILAQILAGITGHDEVAVIEDRREAVAHAIASAAPADVVLLAGKGHEDYQDIGGAKRPYSDVLQARAALAARRTGGAAA
jgi:UDP-N-acetylmuramyl-tripeptide synthetase